jgi:plasmid replication initiation protein
MASTLTISNEFFNVCTDLTRTARKLLFAMLIEAQGQGERNTYSFNVSSLKTAAGISETNTWRDISSALDQLRSFKWDSIIENDTSDMSGLIYDPLMKNGRISEVIISRKLKEMIFHDHSKGNYTKLDLNERSKLKGKHSKRLYELIISKVRSGHRRFAYEELKKLMGSKDKRWSYFERDKLKPSIKEINEVLSFDIAYSPKKQGRRVKEIDIAVTKKHTGKTRLCSKTAKHIDWENELRTRNGVTISILHNIIVSNNMNIDWMIRFWNEELKEAASYIQLHLRGSYIVEQYKSDRYNNAIVEYCLEELEKEEQEKARRSVGDLASTVPEL